MQMGPSAGAGGPVGATVHGEVTRRPMYRDSTVAGGWQW